MAKKKDEETPQDNPKDTPEVLPAGSGQKEEKKHNSAHRKIFRSQYDRVIAGVCGGVADYFNIDLFLVRVIFVLAIFWGGLGVIAYIAAWIIIPENPDEEPKDENVRKHSSTNAGLIGGLALIVFGFLLLVDEIDFPFNFHALRFHSHLDFGMVLSLLFVGLGIYLLINKDNEKGDLSKLISSKKEGSGSTKKLVRSTTERKIAGVCGGLAEYFNVDVSFVRIGYIVFAFASAFFVAIILYIVMIIAIPEDDSSKID
ncbi:MAG: PspC domain-containing protein [Deferribacteres bacterium]|nr:PspC domain-containing protein [candidate division KSB1 bacterium]MCB9503705.1 PspC domain-containing protein [Deferribacteres bacterium]